MSPSRADDERLLEWLRLSDAGVSGGEIARRYGSERGSVNRALRNVRAADDEAHTNPAGGRVTPSTSLETPRPV